jgi:hypothetical protein
MKVCEKYHKDEMPQRARAALQSASSSAFQEPQENLSDAHAG